MAGGTAFGGGLYQQAHGHYSAALAVWGRQDRVDAKLLMNRAVCGLRLGRWQDAIADRCATVYPHCVTIHSRLVTVYSPSSTAALVWDGGYAKALLVRAKAKEALDVLDGSAADLAAALALAPGDAEATAALQRTERQVAARAAAVAADARTAHAKVLGLEEYAKLLQSPAAAKKAYHKLALQVIYASSASRSC